MPETTSDGVRIHYEDEGDGAPVLLLHGHTFDRTVWDEVATALLARGRRALRPDLRGHGRSELPPKGYHVSHHAADMAAVLDAAAVDRAVVTGFSLGGGVALELALTRPERVAGLVLVDPVMPDRPFEPEFFDNLREVARTARRDGIRAAMLGPWMAGPLFAWSFRNPEVRERVSGIVAEFPGADYLASERDAVERPWRVADRLGEVGVPVRVLAGQHDLPGFVAWAREIAEGIPGSTLEVVPGAGHLVPLERPQRVVDAILGV